MKGSSDRSHANFGATEAVEPEYMHAEAEEAHSRTPSLFSAPIVTLVTTTLPRPHKNHPIAADGPRCTRRYYVAAVKGSLLRYLTVALKISVKRRGGMHVQYDGDHKIACTLRVARADQLAQGQQLLMMM